MVENNNHQNSTIHKKDIIITEIDVFGTKESIMDAIIWRIIKKKKLRF